MQKVKIIIAGSRTFNDFNLVDCAIKHYLKQLNLHRNDIEIISGGAKGADKLGEAFAKKYNCTLTIYPANWTKYGKSAGYIRNLEMANYAKPNGILFAFWNNYSKGTKHMIDIANKNNLKVYVIPITS